MMHVITKIHLNLRAKLPQNAANSVSLQSILRIIRISKVQLLDAILQEMSKGGFSEDEESAFWDDFDNLQKAKIIR